MIHHRQIGPLRFLYSFIVSFFFCLCLCLCFRMLIIKLLVIFIIYVYYYALFKSFISIHASLNLSFWLQLSVFVSLYCSTLRNEKTRFKHLFAQFVIFFLFFLPFSNWQVTLFFVQLCFAFFSLFLCRYIILTPLDNVVKCYPQKSQKLLTKNLKTFLSDFIQMKFYIWTICKRHYKMV